MKAYHGKIEIKEQYLARVRMHREADELVKGQYWQNGKGCAVGCTIHGNEHVRYEKELGIPRILARLEDGIFEGLPNGEAMAWPERFLEAISVGADLSVVAWQFLHWLLVDAQEGVIRFALTEKAKAAIHRVAVLMERKAKGEVVSWDEANTARHDAWDGARASWRGAAAADAADAAAAAADDAAADAAAAAAAAAARYDSVYYATREKTRVRQSEKLIELLKAAPVPKEEVAA
jgi:hypothetical protein